MEYVIHPVLAKPLHKLVASCGLPRTASFRLGWVTTGSGNTCGCRHSLIVGTLSSWLYAIYCDLSLSMLFLAGHTLIVDDLRAQLLATSIRPGGVEVKNTWRVFSVTIEKSRIVSNRLEVRTASGRGSSGGYSFVTVANNVDRTG